MPDCKSLVATLGLTSLLALLACVLVSPIRTSGFASSRPNYLRRIFALPGGEPTTRLSPVMAINAVLDVNALRSENDEQDRADALDEPRIALLIPCSLPRVPDLQFIPPRSSLSLYPLRC